MAIRGATGQVPLPTRSSFITQSETAPHSQSSSSSSAAMSPELEQTLSLLSSHRTVLGYLLLSRGHPIRIIRHAGGIFEGDSGKRYARAVGKIVECVRDGLEEVNGDNLSSNIGAGSGGGVGNGEVDELRFMRIRTRRHELMISPDDRYLLVVLHDPAA